MNGGQVNAKPLVLNANPNFGRQMISKVWCGMHMLESASHFCRL
jgi:hypothetical protein